MIDVSEMARAMATECSAHRIRQASRVLTRAYDEALRPHGIQVSQLFVLVAVATAGEDGASPGQIAKTLLMDQTTVSRSVVPLEKAGLLRVARSPHDARSRVVLLTRAGERMIAVAHPAWKAVQTRLRRTLGVERFEALNRELIEVVNHASELESAALPRLASSS